MERTFNVQQVFRIDFNSGRYIPTNIVISSDRSKRTKYIDDADAATNAMDELNSKGSCEFPLYVNINL